MGVRMRDQFAIFVVVLLCSVAWGQTQNGQTQNAPSSGAQQSGAQQSMPGMDMSGHDMSNMQMKDMPMGGDNDKDSDANAGAMHSMEGHMDMGPHMKMTELRKPQPGDAERAQKIVESARKAAEQYLDYHVALADGFKIFHPEIPQKIYHFTSRRNAIAAQFEFDPERPTSLLYEKHGDDYKLVGVMYTAPKRFTEDQLNERVPLSIAQWHEHVNFCRAPADMPIAERMQKSLGPNAEFGFKGSIHTEEACNAAGGRFIPVVFNWMVHVYPFEKDQASIWSVERQHGDAD
ncbi:MAG TPA: hypothetical protein VMD99_14400 [Terriglobales bacterium]|nr:hypothetical protein [Terriglobales bacterium]